MFGFIFKTNREQLANNLISFSVVVAVAVTKISHRVDE